MNLRSPFRYRARMSRDDLRAREVAEDVCGTILPEHPRHTRQLPARVRARVALAAHLRSGVPARLARPDDRHRRFRWIPGEPGLPGIEGHSRRGRVPSMQHTHDSRRSGRESPIVLARARTREPHRRQLALPFETTPIVYSAPCRPMRVSDPAGLFRFLVLFAMRSDASLHEERGCAQPVAYLGPMLTRQLRWRFACSRYRAHRERWPLRDRSRAFRGNSSTSRGGNDFRISRRAPWPTPVL